MAKKYAKKPSPTSAARPAEPASSASASEVEKLREFFVENRYYLFLAVLLLGVGGAIYYWEKGQSDTKLQAVARELDSKRQDPLSDGERVQLLEAELDRVAGDQGRFFEEDLAKEDVDELNSVLARARGTSMEPWVRYHLANRYYAGGSYDEAIAEYEAFLRKYREKGHILVSRVNEDMAKAKAEKEFAALETGKAEPATGDRPRYRVETTAGTFVVELAAPEAPRLADNFQALVRSGWYRGQGFYESDRVPFAEGSNEPFALGSGSPWGDKSGGPGYTLEKANFDAEIAEGTVLVDNEGEDASGSRLWFVRERAVNDPGELAPRLDEAGISEEDRGKAQEFFLTQRALFGGYGGQELFQRWQELSREMTPTQRRASEIMQEYYDQKEQHVTFVEKVDAWRAARSRMVEGKYSVLGKVVEGLDVLRTLDPSKDFILRIEPAAPGS